MSAATTQRRPAVAVDDVAAVPPGYKRTEVGVIPKDWDVSSVGAEFTIQLGKMLDAATNVGALKPYIGNRAVQWGRIDLGELATVPMTLSDMQRFRLRGDDLLVCEGGEIGRAAIWDEPIPECYYQKALHRLRPVRGYNVVLMRSFLEIWVATSYLSNYVTQTSIAHLPKDKFEAVPLPRPAPTEQRVIAGALSDVDGLFGALEALIAKKRDIKQAAIQQLLTGKIRLPGFHKPWGTRRLGELGKCFRGVTYDPASDLAPYDTATTVRLFRGNNIEGDSISTSHLQFVESRRVTESQMMRAEDVLLCTASGSKDVVGKSAQFKLDDGYRYTFGAFMGCFRPDREKANPTFAFYLFQTGRYRAHVGVTLAGSSINNLRPSDVEAAEFLVPERAEQDAIATVLSDMGGEITTLERRREKSRAIRLGMMQQLLTGRVRLVEPEVTG